MAAFIPSRRDRAVNDEAMARVRADKERESGDGFDGTWVAHPDLVPLATGIFDGVLGDRPNQKDRRRSDVHVAAADLLDFRVPDGRVTEAGVRLNVSVALQYLDAWLAGNGAAAINNLMEDAATAEISRSQLWHWRVGGAKLDDVRSVTGGLYSAIRDEELAALGGPAGGNGRLADAAELLDELVLDDAFTEFLTIPAGALLD
jgi:malate synthase